MNMQKPLKCAAVLLSAIVICASTAGSVTAETTLSATEAEELATVSTEAAQEAQEDAAEEEQAEWWKAEITDYDSSLSLISYELTPETTQTEDEVTEDEEAEEDDSEETSEAPEEDADEEEAESSAPEEIAPEETEKAPTPVQDQTTGGTVQNVPQDSQAPVINAKSGQFAFTTRGWGHCVGMSQNGANAYATYSGWSYQDILYHYYPGTYLMNTGTAQTEQVTVQGVTGDVLSMVAGVVYREVGSSMHVEAIKAQAVAVYTYMKYNGNNGKDTGCKANPPQHVIDACASVLGEALYYNGDFALTVFTASTGGATANCYDIFTADIPYLRSVPCAYDASYDPHYNSVKYIASSEVKRLVEARYGVTLSGDPSTWFELVKGDGGYVTKVIIGGTKTVRGYDFKIALGLKSSNFDVSFTQ